MYFLSIPEIKILYFDFLYDEHTSSIEFLFDRLLEPFKSKSKLFFFTLIRNSDTVRTKETNEYPPLRVQRTVYESNVLILIVDILRKSCSGALIYRPIVLHSHSISLPWNSASKHFFSVVSWLMKYIYIHKDINT